MNYQYLSLNYTEFLARRKLKIKNICIISVKDVTLGILTMTLINFALLKTFFEVCC